LEKESLQLSTPFRAISRSRKEKGIGISLIPEASQIRRELLPMLIGSAENPGEFCFVEKPTYQYTLMRNV
jgi:hypothetical protein